MSILSLIFLSMIVTAIKTGMPVLKGISNSESRTQISHIKSIGLFAMIVGVLGQLIGLYSAFAAIEQMGSIAPALLAGGLKVSMITTLYGAIIYMISYLVWMLLSWKLGDT